MVRTLRPLIVGSAACDGLLSDDAAIGRVTWDPFSIEVERRIDSFVVIVLIEIKIFIVELVRGWDIANIVADST